MLVFNCTSENLHELADGTLFFLNKFLVRKFKDSSKIELVELNYDDRSGLLKKGS